MVYLVESNQTGEISMDNVHRKEREECSRLLLKDTTCIGDRLLIEEASKSSINVELFDCGGLPSSNNMDYESYDGTNDHNKAIICNLFENFDNGGGSNTSRVLPPMECAKTATIDGGRRRENDDQSPPHAERTPPDDEEDVYKPVPIRDQMCNLYMNQKKHTKSLSLQWKMQTSNWKNSANKVQLEQHQGRKSLLEDSIHLSRASSISTFAKLKEVCPPTRKMLDQDCYIFGK